MARIKFGLGNSDDAIDPNDRYIKSYPHLVKISKFLCEQISVKTIDENDAIVAIAHVAYGWMPRILNKCESRDEQIEQHEQNKTVLDAFKISTCEEAIDYINDFKYSPINNSWIGLSKVLHFVNPRIFPIWDSNVAKNFKVEKSKMYKKEYYPCYIEFCHSNLKLPAVAETNKTFLKITGYEVTEIRALEFILFNSGRTKGNRR